MDRSRASTPLKDLISQTRYTVSVSAVYDEGESPPATAQETTRELCLRFIDNWKTTLHARVTELTGLFHFFKKKIFLLV